MASGKASSSASSSAISSSSSESASVSAALALAFPNDFGKPFIGRGEVAELLLNAPARWAENPKSLATGGFVRSCGGGLLYDLGRYHSKLEILFQKQKTKKTH